MSSTVTDRIYGESASVAVKAPCVAVSSGALPLSGLGAVGLYTPSVGDRILVKDQANPAANGIYNASLGAWARSGDFDGIYDAVQGTLIAVISPTSGGSIFYQLTTLKPVIGTTPLNFASFINPTSLSYSITQQEVASGAIPVNPTYPPGQLLRYGTNSIPGTTDMAAALQAALNQMIFGGANIALPAGGIAIRSLVSGTVKNGFTMRGAGIGRTQIFCDTGLGFLSLTADGSSFNQFNFEGFTVVCDQGTNSAVGIQVTSGGALPSVTMRDVMVLTDGSHDFARKIKLINCGETLFERTFLYGIAACQAAILITNSGAPAGSGTVYKFIGCSIYNTTIGVDFENATIPGIEGVQFSLCDIVGVQIGVKARTTTIPSYFPTQLAWIGGHNNASVSNFDMQGFTQFVLQGAVLYSESTTAQILLNDVSNLNINGNEFVQLLNSAAGIKMSTTSSGPFPIGNIGNNNFTLGAGATAILLTDATGFTNGLIHDNNRFGGAAMVGVSAGTLDPTVQIINNSPIDQIDAFQSIATTAAMSLIGIRAGALSLATPGSPVAIATMVPRGFGDKITLFGSSNTITIPNSGAANSFAISGGGTYTFGNANQTSISFLFGPGNIWNETGRSG